MEIRPMGEWEAREIAGWEYPPPYDFYNMNGEGEEELRGDEAVFDDGSLVGFFCTGAEARVPEGYGAGAYPEGAGIIIDIGLGMNPERTGRGGGMAFLTLILGHLRADRSPAAFRLTVADFNERAIRLYRKAGFRETASFLRNDTRFLVLVKKEK
ncbi:GNAT family N-acetyltransferase [Bhargavaea beijingensis]|uniref:N-acetyltransferase n=1 Tax=Bhargavaea beijingensis TaxID=426756 RepID=A0ABX9ZCI7_9BACL|nr:GNAT family protein [Bhargavaea beijingensis]RSK31862.1 N-acetyltransferase [Bhargavaea beijingensis]